MRFRRGRGGSRISPTLAARGGTPLQEANEDVPLDGVHFHDWTDYDGVAFSIELLERGRKFSDFGVK